MTYLHHHGPSDPEEEVPWYRGEEWSYFRGGLSTIDRDYGIFNKLHHDIGTHVVHHLFPQVCGAVHVCVLKLCACAQLLVGVSWVGWLLYASGAWVAGTACGVGSVC